jgi:hypothetical protein
MSRRKKISSHFDQAVVRCAAIKSIHSSLDLGNGLTVAVYEAALNDLRDKLNDYNTHLSLVDEKRSRVLESELFLKDLSDRMLSGVAAKYGRNSEEYTKAGGTRKVDRIRPKRKPPLTA